MNVLCSVVGCANWATSPGFSDLCKKTWWTLLMQLSKIKLNLDVCVLGTGVKILNAKLMDVKSRALHADVASSMAHSLIVLSHPAPKVFTGINSVTAIGCSVILLQS